MSNLKNKVSYKVMALLMAVLMLISMVPATLIAYALGSDEPNPLEAKNLVAVYNAATETVEMKWDAFETAPYKLFVYVNGEQHKEIDVATTSYSYPVTAVTPNSYSVKAYADASDTTGVETDRIIVHVAATLVAIPTFAEFTVENNVTIAEIIAGLPTGTQLNVNYDGKNTTTQEQHKILWNAEGADYDRSLSTEQTITVPGVVVLDETKVKNRDGISLNVFAVVKVKAATDVSITKDLDDSQVNTKKVGEKFALSMEVAGTAPTYQWYKKAKGTDQFVAVAGATSATLDFASLTEADSGEYHCAITGKNGSTAISKTVRVEVTKNYADLSLSVEPVAGQTRPNPIEITVLGVPYDALGTVTVKHGDVELHKVTLDGTNDEQIKFIFKPTGESDTFVFTVVYSGDGKYDPAQVSAAPFDFTKGTQQITKVDGIPSSLKAGDKFTVVPSATVAPESDKVVKFTYAVSDSNVASVDENGVVTTLKQGKFKVIITAVGDENYNASVYSTEELTVDYADRSGLSFNKAKELVNYFTGFSYAGMAYKDDSLGGGEYVFSIVSAPTADIVIDEKTGVVKFVDSVDPTKPDAHAQTGDVVVRLTKKTDGKYAEIYAEYILSIIPGDQAPLVFEQQSVTLTYTADALGNPLTTIANTATGGSVKAPVVYSIVNGEDVIKLDPEKGIITAIKSGEAEIKAQIQGNTFFNVATATYKVKVEKGTVSGFGFTTIDNLTTPYGVNFENKAGDKSFDKFGQANSSHAVSYAIESVSDEIKEYVDVDANGVVYFDGDYALAKTASQYTVAVSATKAANEYYNPCKITYTLIITRSDVDASKDFTVNGEVIKNATLVNDPDGWYNKEHYNAKGKDIVIKPDGEKYTLISEDGKNWAKQIDRDEDAKYALNFYLKNEVTGEVSAPSAQTVNYDKTDAKATLTVKDSKANVWDKFVTTITFGIWKNTSKEISIEATDNLSGIMSIEYYEQNDNFKDTVTLSIEDVVEDFDWIKCDIDYAGDNKLKASDVITVSLASLTNKKVVVYAKVTDFAGNVSYFRTNGMVFDNVTPDQETILPDPVIEIKLGETAKQGLYNADVPFTLKVNDEKTGAVASGIKNIKVTISGTEAEKYNKVINVTAKASEICSFNSDSVNADEFTVDSDFIVPGSFDSNYLTILVEIEDYAGNKYTNNNKLTNLAIDKTAPVVSVVFNDDENTFSNGKYIGNSKNRKARIFINELNFNNAGAVITVTRDGQPINIVPNFQLLADADAVKDENEDLIGWFMDIDFGTYGEGEYTFDVKYTDKAKNVCSGWTGDTVAVNKNFIIDNTKPVIKVEISNSAVKNEKYFAQDRTATVTVIERNFSKDYKFDWSGLTLSLDGAPLAAPTPVIVKNDGVSYERVYTIDFSAEGDYTFDVKYTDLADNLTSSYSCSSVAYKEFTVDKTAPALAITGVADLSANKGHVAPVITYSDVNFDKQTVSIELSGINNGVVNYKGAYTEDVHGQTFTYADFETVKAVDDIYTLSASLTDLAGNSSAKTIRFSANRFGSVYDLSLVKDIIGKYLQNEQDIVFTETNVDALDHEGIQLKITKNGTPADLVEGTDYIVEATGGNGQWSVYKYTVKKNIFTDDARYSVSVYSKDKAGNVNENIDETKEAEISFGIDKTKPVIVPIDFENGVQYAVDTKTVSIEIKDNLVLEGVKIYLNGKEIEYKVDGETYTFDVPKSTNKQDVKVVAIDAAGNEQPVEINNFLVNANFFVRWYNNTPLFIGSIVGVVLLALGLTIFLLFFKKKKETEEKK